MDNLYVLTGEEPESHGYLNADDDLLFIIGKLPQQGHRYLPPDTF